MFKKLLSLAVLIPGFAFGLPLNSYFNQGATINNFTSQTILITDPAVPQILNYPIGSQRAVTATYASDQFTQAGGQLFSHTIKVFSGVDYSPICTVISNLYITTTTLENKRPSTTDEKRCEPSVYVSMVNGRTVYGFQINVR